MSGYSRAEFGVLTEHGGRLIGPAVREERMGSTVWTWSVHPAARLSASDRPPVRLQLRYSLNRPERAHLTLILRTVPVVRLDTNDAHRERGVLREGTHLQECPDPDFPRGTTTFDLVPPLVGFPDAPVPGELVPYWVPVRWLCARYKIDCSALDQDELEEEVPHEH